MTGLLDDLAGSGRFVLFGDGVDPVAGLSDEARAVWRQLDGRGVTIGEDGFRDVEGSYAEWFRDLGAGVVLVRPDFQVFGTAPDDAGADALVRDLGARLRLSVAVTA